MGILLSIIAFVLVALIAPIAMIFGSILALCKREANKYFTDIAIAIDVFGNVSCKYLFNLILITSDGYQFGLRKETISSVLGKNKKKGTLTMFGSFVSYILNKLDPNHVEKSIDDNVN
jgi:8-oxo-dGTP diphosphatase